MSNQYSTSNDWYWYHMEGELTGIMPNSIRSLASTCLRYASFSALSSSADVAALWWAWSASDAARRPGDSLAGTPNPRYCNKEYQQWSKQYLIQNTAVIFSKHYSIPTQPKTCGQHVGCKNHDMLPMETLEMRKHLLTLLLSRQKKNQEATFKTCELLIYG